MARITPEGEIKKSILEWLRYQKNCVVFPIATTGLYDPTNNRFRKSAGRPGTPDILCCWNGRFVAIEVKSKSGRLTQAQEEALEEVQNRGKGIAIVARSIEDVQAALHGKVTFF